VKKLLFLTGITAILLLSCDLLFGPITDPSSTSRKFWAQDFSKDHTDPLYYYQLDASLLAENDYCKVWAEKSSKVTKSTAQDVANAYRDIYTRMLKVFGNTFRKDNVDYNTIQLADYYSDGDGKLCILLLDIKDDYKPGVNEAAVGGYFFSGDLINFKNSNLCDMIYIDTNPGHPGRAESNMTLAHELQHLMNEITSMENRYDGKQYYNQMDLWINEGLSSAAEWVYLQQSSSAEKHPRSRWGWYKYNGDGYGDAEGLIDKGNNFFVWGNRDKENQYAVLDDYATVYLFFQWLRIQNRNGEDIYKDIISSEYSDYKAVTETAKEINSSYSNWENLLGDWLSANYDAGSPGSYRNDPELSQIKMHLLSTNEQTVDLYPGEGVFSMIADYYEIYEGYPSVVPFDSTAPNIRYRVFEADPETTDHQGTLLTFNVNSVKEEPESGIITGVVVPEETPEDAAASVQGRSAMTRPATPYWIGAGDVRRGEAARPSPVIVPLLRRNFTVSE